MAHGATSDICARASPSSTTEILRCADCEPQYHYRLKSSWDPESDTRHQYKENGRWVHRDKLFSSVNDNKLLDWITGPLPRRNFSKRGFGALGIEQQQSFKSLIERLDDGDVNYLFSTYDIARMPALRDFVWPDSERDYEGARERMKDKVIHVRNRCIGFQWAFDTGGGFPVDIEKKMREKFPNDKDLWASKSPAVDLSRKCKPYKTVERDPSTSRRPNGPSSSGSGFVKRVMMDADNSQARIASSQK